MNDALDESLFGFSIVAKDYKIELAASSSNKERWEHNRVQFQKHKLKFKIKEFDESPTDWKNMQRASWNGVWDCGTYQTNL